MVLGVIQREKGQFQVFTKPERGMSVDVFQAMALKKVIFR